MTRTAIYDGEAIDIFDVISFARDNEALTLIESGITREGIGCDEFERRIHDGIITNADSYANQYRVSVSDWIDAIEGRR